MIIKLEAYLPEEGAAIARIDNQLRFARPPAYDWFGKTSLVDEKSIEEAVIRYDFYASDKEFSSLTDLYAFLNQQACEYYKVRGIELPERFDRIEWLNVAPLRWLDHFLDEVENVMIPNKEYGDARSFLVDLLGSQACQRYRTVEKRARRLLKTVMFEIKTQQEIKTTIFREKNPLALSA